MKCVGLIILFLHWSLSDAQRFVLTGPAGPVVADPGSNIILPCSLNPHESAVNMSVTWSRPDLNNRVVHHYKDQQDKTSEQDPFYTDRTSLFKEKLKDGIASLLLRNVQLSDEGKYTCEVQDKGAYDSLRVQVTIPDIGKIPEITILGDYVFSGVHLLCETKGWRVDPELQWMDSEGRELTVGNTEKHKDKELYTVRHSISTTAYGTRIICRVKQHPSMKKEISISSQFSNQWKTGFIVLFAIVTVGLLLTGWAYCRRILCCKPKELRQNKETL